MPSLDIRSPSPADGHARCRSAEVPTRTPPGWAGPPEQRPRRPRTPRGGVDVTGAVGPGRGTAAPGPRTDDAPLRRADPPGHGRRWTVHALRSHGGLRTHPTRARPAPPTSLGDATDLADLTRITGRTNTRSRCSAGARVRLGGGLNPARGRTLQQPLRTIARRCGGRRAGPCGTVPNLTTPPVVSMWSRSSSSGKRERPRSVTWAFHP